MKATDSYTARDCIYAKINGCMSVNCINNKGNVNESGRKDNLPQVGVSFRPYFLNLLFSVISTLRLNETVNFRCDFPVVIVCWLFVVVNDNKIEPLSSPYSHRNNSWLLRSGVCWPQCTSILALDGRFSSERVIDEQPGVRNMLIIVITCDL